MLVFNEKNEVISDIAALYGQLNDLLTSKALFDFICDESDWIYLEHYLLSALYFSQYDYPLCEQSELNDKFLGKFLLYTNAYVTKAYRNQHLFSNMLDLIIEFASQDENTVLYEVISLDPDVASYGPDKNDKLYYYSMEIDEPKRLLNASIMRQLDYKTICINECDDNTDGCKRWFAYDRKQIIFTDKN